MNHRPYTPQGNNNHHKPRTHNNNRMRPRHNNHTGGAKAPQKSQAFDSNGPEVRIRGTAYQILEKYLSLARDANATGDIVLAENYYQHAEHYQRVIQQFAIDEAAYRASVAPAAPLQEESAQPLFEEVSSLVEDDTFLKAI